MLLSIRLNFSSIARAPAKYIRDTALSVYCICQRAGRERLPRGEDRVRYDGFHGEQFQLLGRTPGMSRPVGSRPVGCVFPCTPLRLLYSLVYIQYSPDNRIASPRVGKA